MSIRLIAPFPWGGSIDTSARLIVSAVSEALGQPLVAENKVDAEDDVGADADAVVQLPKDG